MQTGYTAGPNNHAATKQPCAPTCKVVKTCRLHHSIRTTAYNYYTLNREAASCATKSQPCSRISLPSQSLLTYETFIHQHFHRSGAQPSCLAIAALEAIHTPVGPACAGWWAEANCLSAVLPGSLRMSLEAPVAADQMCRLPEASQEAMWALLLAPPTPSQHSPEIRLLCPVCCTSAANQGSYMKQILSRVCTLRCCCSAVQCSDTRLQCPMYCISAATHTAR